MTEIFSPADLQLIRSKIEKTRFSLIRTYAPFLLALLIAYFSALPEATSSKISIADFDKVYSFVFIFFLLVFLFFFIKDYKKSVVPFKKEIATGEKKIQVFYARKFFDPIYKQHLLYHPFQENKYLLVSELVFNAIEEGQEVEIHTGVHSGLVFAMKMKDELISDIEEFSYR